MRSDEQYLGVERSLQRAWAKGAGLIDEEFDRPMIAVVNTYQDFSPENIHLRQVGDAVKAGIRMAGGTPCEFNTFHVTDSETFASVGMRYVLPSRDVVADMIELMVEGHRFDAMVLIGSGDKVVPGMVMAAARLDLPSIMLYGGPTKAGVYKQRKVFLETVYDGVGEHLRGKLCARDLKGLEDNHFPFPGACDTATSGNTAGIYTEALGLALPHTGTFPAGSNYQIRAAKYTGMRIRELLKEDLRPSQILTRDAFENAMRVGMAVGGSTNMVLHMIAMAKEAGVEVSFDTWDRLSRETPTLVKLAPSGPWGVTELGEAGGVPAVMKALGDLVDPATRTVSGRSTGELIAEAVIENPDCIRSKDSPVEEEGSIYILKGSLAPGGAVVKASGVAREMWDVELSARVFEDEESAIDALRDGRIQPGTCIVIQQRGNPRRSRHARDAGCYVRPDGGRSRQELRPRHRRPLLRRHPWTRHRIRHPGGGTVRADRARRRRRSDTDRFAEPRAAPGCTPGSAWRAPAPLHAATGPHYARLPQALRGAGGACIRRAVMPR